MVEFAYAPRTFSDPSELTEGLHPCLLLEVVEEPVPEGWEMAKKDPLMWRWFFAVWESPADLTRKAPELQSGVSSRTFSPGGKYQASKAYVWMTALLRRPIVKGERFDPNALAPLPGLLDISRTGKEGNALDFANVLGVRRWEQGESFLTPALRHNLLSWWQGKKADLALAQRSTPSSGAREGAPVPTAPSPNTPNLPQSSAQEALSPPDPAWSTPPPQDGSKLAW